MHPHNSLYGQHQALAIYAGGMDYYSVPSIPGHLQHDWDLTHPCPASDLDRPSLTTFVWSDAARRRRSARGLRGHVVIGAPWLYLLEKERKVLPQPPRPAEEHSEDELVLEGTLWLPEHDVHGVHAASRLIQEIRERESGPVTVALSHKDHAVPELRAAYAEAGYTVVALGDIDDEPGTADPRYLLRLRDLFIAHDRVATNVVDAPLLYAASMDVPTQVYGASPAHAATGGVLDELRSPDASPHLFAEVARAELGRDHLMPPAELRAVLEWSNRG